MGRPGLAFSCIVTPARGKHAKTAQVHSGIASKVRETERNDGMGKKRGKGERTVFVSAYESRASLDVASATTRRGQQASLDCCLAEWLPSQRRAHGVDRCKGQRRLKAMAEQNRVKRQQRRRPSQRRPRASGRSPRASRHPCCKGSAGSASSPPPCPCA